jgi:cation diffusion facilitator family transporter
MDRLPAIRRVLLLTFVLNLVVAVAKGMYGALSGSLAVASDAVHSAMDAAGNVVGWLTTTAAAEPPDAEHPYGHHKVEIVAATLLGFLIAGGALQFGYTAVRTLVGSAEHSPHVGAGGFLIVGGTLVVNIFVALWERKKGRELKSAFLQADAAHTASDVIVTIGVLISLALTHSGLTWADPVASLIVLLIVARVAWHILTDNLGVLLDRVVIDPDLILAVVTSVEGVTDCHRIRSRGSATAVHLDLHVQAWGGTSLTDAHALAHVVEDRIRAEFPAVVDVTIHMEPHDEVAEGL